MNGIMTNKIIVSFDLNQILDKYIVYQFSTNQKYIKFNSKIFDEDLMALSIVHESGKRFFALYTANNSNQSLISEKLRKAQEGKDYSINIADIKTIPEYLLVQLFLNAMPNPQDNHFTFNNVTGKLYCINPDGLYISKSGIVYEIPALEIKVNNRLEVELNIKTFTSLSLKNKIQFNKTKLMDYPQYKFFNGKLVRIINEEVSLQDKYILRKATNRKNNMDFINFTDYKSFRLSKCGMLNKILNQFNKRFGEFINLEFEEICDAKEMQLTKELSLEKNKNIEKFIDQNAFVVVDRIRDSFSKMFIDKFVIQIKSIFNNINISQDSVVRPDKQNFVLIHNKEYYDGGEDEYINSTMPCIQHITYEDFGLESNASIENVVKELYIKNDLSGRKITIINWESFNFQQKMSFGMKVEDRFVFIEINKDGNFCFCTVELNLFDLSEYQKYVEFYEAASINRDVEGIMIDDNKNVSVLYKSKKFTLPKFMEIGQHLYQASKKRNIGKEELLIFLGSISPKDSMVDKYYEAIENSDELVYYREQIISIIKDRSTRKKLSDIIEAKTGIPLKTYMRGKEKKAQLFSSNMDLHFYKVENMINYFVGEKGQGIKLSFPRASLIREIEGDVDATKIMPLMMVDFVRNEQLTVIPFPFKYLREFIALKK